MIYKNDVPKMNKFAMLELKICYLINHKKEFESSIVGVRELGDKESKPTIGTVYWQWKVKSSTTAFDFCIS